MSLETSASGVPATERAIVGLCHGLNDQLAAISAYVYLLERRGQLGDLGPSVQAHLDKLAASVRQIRLLVREPEPDVAPVALSVLAECATDLMNGYPEGEVVFKPRTEDEAVVVRTDFARALRALLQAGAWCTRGVARPLVVELAHTPEGRGSVLLVQPVEDVGAPPDAEIREEAGAMGIALETIGARAVRIRFPAPESA